MGKGLLPTGTAVPTLPQGSGGTDVPDNIKYVSIDRFVFATVGSQKLKKLYGNFKPEVILDKDTGNATTAGAGVGFMEIRDPWGTKLVYAAYVRSDGAVSATPGGPWADDFLPRREEMFFASAGRDKKWGYVGANAKDSMGNYFIPNTDLAAYLNTGETLGSAAQRDRLTNEASDNIYSFGTLNTQ